MSSISDAFGVGSNSEPLECLKDFPIRNVKNFVLLVIDGLGFNFLQNQDSESFLKNSIVGNMTSVFPSTTATSITSFLTGVSPVVHGVTGWHMYLKSHDVCAAVLPFKERAMGSLKDLGLIASDLIKAESLFNKIKSKTYYCLPKKLNNSIYTNYLKGAAEPVPFKTFPKLTKKIGSIVKRNTQRKYIYAYWDQFDHLCHRHGTNSLEVQNHFLALEYHIHELYKNLKGTDTSLIICSDHGFVNVKREETLWMEDYPILKDGLALPLCGDGRMPYCYLHPEKASAFKDFISSELQDKCELASSEELIEKGYWGIEDAQPWFRDRVGDVVLLMKGFYAFKDLLPGEKKFYLPGRHGGLSDDEMLIPLIGLHPH